MNFKIFFIILYSFSFVGCSSIVRFNSTFGAKNFRDYRTESEYSKNFRGFASYYGNEFQGRKTANGEIYDSSKLTAAHKTIPFGTLVKVTNLKNNKSVIVKINDRGPFVEGRIIDLSYAAARQIDMLWDGVVQVEVEILE